MKVKKISNVGVTARQLVKTIIPVIHTTSQFVKPIKMKKSVQDGITRYDTVTRTSEAGAKPRTHNQVIFVLNKPLISDKQSRVMVNCTCDFFWSYCEVALYRVGSAQIINSNGEAPKITNPRMIPMCCLTGGTKVSTKKGLVRLDSIKVNDTVRTLLGYNKVTASSYMGKKITYKVTVSNGMNIHATDNHPILVRRKDMTFEWKLIGDLRIGDNTVILKHTYNSKEIVSYADIPLALTSLQNDISISPVVAITKVGMRKVYDISVDKAEHFIANGIVVHNCKHLHVVLDRLIRSGK